MLSNVGKLVTFQIYYTAKELNLIESYDFGFNDADIKLCSRFAEFLNESFDGLDEAIGRWRTLLKHAVQTPMDMPLRRALTIIPKKAAALCLLNGKVSSTNFCIKCRLLLINNLS